MKFTYVVFFFFFFSSRRRHTRLTCDWSSRRVLFRSPSSLGISALAPSESPGGLTHTNASRCDAGKPGGVACGGSPRPAPLWLHHRPRCCRGSILDALTNVLR